LKEDQSIIIIQKLDLDRPLSASSNSLSKGLPSRLRPFSLEFSTIFGILLLLFLLVTWQAERKRKMW